MVPTPSLARRAGISISPGTDTVILNAVTNLGTGKNLSVSAETINVYRAQTATGNGSISLNAGQNVVVNANVTGGSGGVSILGQGLAALNTIGVMIQGGAVVTTTGIGNVSVAGTGGSSYYTSWGVYVRDNSLVTSGGSGSVSVLGIGNTGTNSNLGIYIYNSQISSGGGNVSVTGLGNGSVPVENYGVLVSGGFGMISSGGSGTVTVTGTGGDGAAPSNYGVNVRYGSVTSGGGNVTVTGIDGSGLSAVALNVGDSGTITTATNGGSVTLIGNSMNFAATANLSAQAGSIVTLQQRTNGVPINLGTAGDPSNGPLNLTDAELDRVTAGTMQFGDASSGAITVTADITRSAATNINLINGASIDFTTGLLNSAGGNVTLNAGTTIGVSKSGIDVNSGAGTLAFGSGDDLSVIINGTTADTLHSQLNVAGGANITGLDLVISGTYTPTQTDSFFILNNDSNDPIVGAFNFLAEGSLVSVNGTSKRITYIGGTGNVVVLLELAPPSVVSTTPSFEVSGSIAAGTTSIQVTFSEPVLNANVATNYQLRRAGSDGLLLDSDTVINPTSVNVSGSTATLSFALPGGLTFVDQLPTPNPYRWQEFSSYDQNYGWIMNNNTTMFGGVNPSTWGDGNGLASQMSTDPAVLATLFTNKGYAGSNAMMQADTWLSYSSTNSKHYAALFQVQNSTGSPITWTPSFYYTAYDGWGEKASVALNGSLVWSSSGSPGSGSTQSLSISIPANSTSTVIFISASDVASGASRTNALGFFNNSLALPGGLTFVDYLDGLPSVANLTSSNGIQFDIDASNFGTGELIQGTSNAFDGLNRLQVNGSGFTPTASLVLGDGDRTLVTSTQVLSGLIVAREVTVPNSGSQDFARTVDVFTNPTGSPITTTVRIIGNLGSDAATTVFKTMNGDGTFDSIVDATDRWIGTDDAEGTGTPAIIHYIHGPSGIVPTTAQVVGDNIEWIYNLTVPANSTVRLAHFTILDTTRGGAEADADALVTSGGFGGEAARFLSPDELNSLANFQFKAKIEFSAATGSDTESSGGNLPKLLVKGILPTTQTIDVIVTGGSATAGTDFTITATVTIPAGTYDGTLATAVDINLSITNDSVVESNETIQLALANPSAGLEINDANGNSNTQSTHTYTITNNDTASLTISDISRAEDGTFTFTITSDRLASQDMTVVVNTADDTATLAGLDYTQLTNVLATITAGSTSTTVTVTVNNDAIVENNETFLLNLSDAKFNGATDASRIVIGDAQGQATIENNDTASLTISSQSITEGDSGSQIMTFTVVSSLAVQGGFTLAFSPTNISTASGDYSVTTTSPLSFAGTQGETKTISVAIIGDTTVEPNETFKITLGAVGSTSTVQAAAITTGAYGTGTIIDNDTATTVGAASVQYSDTVQLSATISTGMPASLNGTVTFSIFVGGSWIPYASAAVIGLPTPTTVSATTSQVLLAPAGYGYKAEFTSSSPVSYSGSAGTGTLTVTQEDAQATYVGPTYVSTPSATATTAIVPLQATIVDFNDGFRGNVDNDPANVLTNARVTFMVYDGATNGLLATIPNVPVNLINPADPTVGTAISNWSANIGSADAVTYLIRTIVTNYYTRDKVVDDELVTVAKPLDNSITGGGYLINTDSAGLYAADDNRKTNFGFNVKFNKNLTNVQGKVNIIFRRMETDGVLHVYQIKSTATTSLGINPADGTGTFLSKATLTDVTNSAAPISLGGNLNLTVTTDDNGEPGSGSNSKGTDKVSVTLFNGPVLWYSSNWNGVQSQLQILDGGNIRNHPNTEKLLYFVNSVASPIAPGDQTINEGNNSPQNMVFTVKLSQASTQTVKVDYNTADNSPAVGAATAVQDYVPKSGTLTFAPGVTIQTITIVINGDPLDEPDENFFINLSNPIGAGIQDPTAVGLILDDDLPAPLLVLGGAATSGNNAGAVSNDAVQPLLTAAIEHWRAAGADLLRLNNLDALQGQVTDLPHSTLGLASQDLILIDRDAAGYGWFVDSTPLDDREFEVGVGSPASGLVDLLSVVTHELGHLLGYGHEHDGQDVMGEYLPVGNRRLPAIDRKDEDWSAQVDLALIDIAKTRHPPVNVVSQELPLDTRRKTAILASQGVTPRLLMKASAGFDELGTKDKPATIASSLKPVTKAFSQVDDELLELLVSSQSTRPRRK